MGFGCLCPGQAGLGAVPAFRVPEYELQSVFELPLVLVLGALCGVAAAAFKAASQARGQPRGPLERIARVFLCLLHHMHHTVPLGC